VPGRTPQGASPAHKTRLRITRKFIFNNALESSYRVKRGYASTRRRNSATTHFRVTRVRRLQPNLPGTGSGFAPGTQSSGRSTSWLKKILRRFIAQMSEKDRFPGLAVEESGRTGELTCSAGSICPRSCCIDRDQWRSAGQSTDPRPRGFAMCGLRPPAHRID